MLALAGLGAGRAEHGTPFPVLHPKYKRIGDRRKSEVKRKEVQLKFEVVKMKNGTVPLTGG